MRKFSEQRFLADLYKKDSVHAVYEQSLIDALDNLARGTGVALSGDTPAPPPVNAINVKASGEMVHVTLTHAAEVSRAIEYYVEADTNPNFTAPPVIRHMGPSRSDILHLPTLNDSGVTQKWYLRAYAQYPGSKPSQPTVFGGLANPTPITLQGTTKMTPSPSTGSGTASTTGQQGGSGRGKSRVSTPKVIRIGKSQASNVPVVPLVTSSAIHLLAAVTSSAQQTTVFQVGTSTQIKVNGTNPGDGAFFLGDLSINAQSATIDPGSFGTWYVYHDDPNIQGGTVSYKATKNITDLRKGYGRFFDGVLTTSAAGGASGGVTGNGLIGLSNPIQSVGMSSLSSNVSIANTNTTITSITVTMPPTGGPFRALISYTLWINFSGATNINNINFWVSDGTNVMNGCETGQSNAANGGRTMAASSQVSPASYANNQVVTFTLLGIWPSTSPFPVAEAAPDSGSGPNSNLQVVIMPSVN